jgi:hypothetical protein
MRNRHGARTAWISPFYVYSGRTASYYCRRIETEGTTGFWIGWSRSCGSTRRGRCRVMLFHRMRRTASVESDVPQALDVPAMRGLVPRSGRNGDTCGTGTTFWRTTGVNAVADGQL